MTPRLVHWIFRRMRAGAGPAMAALLGSAMAPAVSPAAPADLTLGQVVPIDDPNPVGRHLQQGLRLCVDEINQQGGIHGARLRLESRHRGLDLQDSVQRTRALLAERRPIALVALMGTGPTEALLQARVLAGAGVPVIGVRSGATSLRQGQGTDWLFHTRAGYAAEVARVFEHWRTVGITRVGLYVEDSRFGAELRTLFDDRAAQGGLTVAATSTHPLRGTDAAKAVARAVAEGLRRAGPNPTVCG